MQAGVKGVGGVLPLWIVLMLDWYSIISENSSKRMSVNNWFRMRWRPQEVYLQRLPSWQFLVHQDNKKRFRDMEPEYYTRPQFFNMVGEVILREKSSTTALVNAIWSRHCHVPPWKLTNMHQNYLKNSPTPQSHQKNLSFLILLVFKFITTFHNEDQTVTE